MFLMILNCIYHAHDTHDMRVICAPFFNEFCCMNFLSQLRYEVSSLQTRVLVNFEVGFKARFLNGFIMILKMLYMHVKFEAGSWPAS